MAENDQEMNPRKKLKTEHSPDQNGDSSQTELTEALEKAGSSQDRGDSYAEMNNKNEACKKDVAIKDKHGNGPDDVEREKLEITSKNAVGEENKDNEEKEIYDVKDTDGDSNRDVDVSDGESDVSAFSDMSGLSGEDSWKAAPAGPMAWVYRCMVDGVDPRSILSQILSDDHEIPDVDDFTLWKLVVNLVSEPPPRNKLPDINTLEDVIQLLQKCEKIIVLTGAGVSVSCGIPDFRSRNGIYARLAVDFPDLPDPQAMFDIRYFKKDQRPFFKFAKEIYPGQFEPSRCHKFIQLIEEHGKLLRNYTQNIDTLEQVAGIKNVIQCHGSFAKATCMQCNHKCSSEDIKEEILNQVIPMCPKCDPRTPLSVMKPDIVFFGESLPEEFHHQMSVDKDNCDLLIVIGSSLKVRPVALIPNSLPAHVPQILINKEHLRNLNFDVELLGDCDIVVGEICRRLGKEWSKIASEESLSQICMDELLTPVSSPKQAEKNLENSETKTEKTENTIGEEKGRDQNSGNESSSNSEAVVNSEVTVTESDDKCLCNDVVNETKDMTNIESKKSGNAESSKTELSDLAEKRHTETRTTAGELENDETVKSDENKNVQGNSTSSKTDRLDTAADINKSNIDAKPGSSSVDREISSSDVDVSGMRGLWKSYRHNVACRLGSNKFCFVPPNKYIFPEAEYFTWLKSDSDSDADTESSLDSSRELNETQTTTESSALDDKVIDLTSDDTEDKQNLKEVTNLVAAADSVNSSDIDVHSKDPVTCAKF